MRFLCCVILVLICVPYPTADAKIIINSGLVLEDGVECLEMRPGEKRMLKIRDEIWNLPVGKRLEFSSKRPLVAYVNSKGVLHALMPGRTVISVWNSAGDNGTLEVYVVGEGKLSLWNLVLFFVLGGSFGAVFATKIFRCF